MRERPSLPARIRRQGTFHLDLPPADAFKLFTAEGERLWVSGWSPVVLGALPQRPGLVFTTGAGTEHTIWTVIESDGAAGRVRYSRVTPGSRAGIVTVDVAPAPGGSRVVVAYDLTALDAEGGASLEPYAPERFEQMMEDWRALIAAMPSDRRAGLALLTV